MVLLKIYITKIKNSFVYKELLNNYFLVAFLLLLVLISITNYVCIVFLLIYIIYLYKQTKTITYIAIGLSLLLTSHFLFLNFSYKYLDKIELEGMVINIKEDSEGKKITLKDRYRKYIIYDYSDVNVQYGDIIHVKGRTLSNDTNRVKNGFNYQKYLKQSRIFCTMLANDIEVINSRFHFGIIKHYFLIYLNNTYSYDANVFLKAMVIGDLDDLDEDFRSAILDNGILHLFAVSGLHIVLFIELIEKVLKFFCLKQERIDLINSLFLILYLVLTNFSPSVLRASLMYYISLLNKKLKLGFSTLDIVSIIFIILILYNPLYYYNLGFNLSFISSTLIVLVGDLCKGYNKYLQVLIVSILVNLVTFPLVININGKINALSPVSNVIFIELVEVIVLPLSFFILVFPLFKELYNLIIVAFNKITLLFSKYFIINLKFPYLNNYCIILYFILLFLLVRIYHFKKFRYALSFVLVLSLFLFSNKIYIFPQQEIHFLDLVNGEASLIIDSQNECYALIDTGDGTSNEVTTYLKRVGIKKLDYVFITHNHLDHNGELKNIIKKIKVNNFVFGAYDTSVTNYFFNNGEKFANVIRVKANDEVTCGKNTFYILHPDRKYSNENDNSIVIYAKIGGLHFLFLGDVTKDIEAKIAGSKIDVDVIKIAHHGSSTSSSAYLFEKLKPQYAIIMTGRVEKFGFPNYETIATLNKYNVITYRTDLNYSIIYKYKKNKSIFITLR